jgi:hypothetical protein
MAERSERVAVVFVHGQGQQTPYDEQKPDREGPDDDHFH